jgi:MFS family permease
MNRNLALLMCGQLVSQIGDKFHMLAVAFLVLKTTGSPAKMGLALFCSIFPSMLLGCVAGAFVDRYNRKLIIIAADVARGLIVAILCVLYYLGSLSFAVLLIAQVLISACSAFFDPAIPAIIPQIVQKEQLTRANSQTQFVSGISTIVGPVLGGLTVVWAGYLPVFAINACSYLISAAVEGFLCLPEMKSAAVGQLRLVEDMVQGWRYVYRRKHLILILVIVGAIHLFVGSVEVVIPVLAEGLRGAGAENMGFIQTFFGLGTVLAALILSIKNIGSREVKFLFGSVAIIGLLLLAVSGIFLSGIRSVAPYLVLFLLIGGSVIFAGTSFRSLLQRTVDIDMMGRVFGVVSSIGNISIPLAALICGLLMEYVPQSLIVAASGLALVTVGTYGYLKYTGDVAYTGRKHRESFV